MPTNLNPKQLKFANLYLANSNATASYKAAYNPQMESKRAEACSSRLLSSAKVQEYLAIKRQELEKTAVITAREVAVEVLNISRDPFEKNRLKGYEILNKMYGYNAPEKQEVEHKGALLAFIEQLKND
jgi:phage terminase small subunit